ncbi:ribosome small subunit-dependent GTPase A [Patulibacter sp.]|uniref:ribosome small subunit-dependent GTPase A n=1 Tax=Patulibacter sp. TaxID=1912859 RepID=UPI002720334F|nr:ribosome small subunit-dependent GTPase A [Patulibacter sp.]MDO9408552.1 ribosome small subunit-dependent GTPase A [Patulibacter sp.]
MTDGDAVGDGEAVADLWDLPDPLSAAGWNDAVAADMAPYLTGGRQPARVARIEYGGCHLVTAHGRSPGVGRLGRTSALDDDRSDTPLAVGDWVATERDKSDDRLLAVAVGPRHRLVGRRDPSRELLEQVLASNVDAVLVVHALDRPLRPSRIERSLVIAHEGDVQPIVVATKADLDLPAEWRALQDEIPPGTPVVAVSKRDGRGFDELEALLPRGGTTGLIGESGAGKSSIVNALLGRELLATGAVRGTDAKGRHTTTARELVPLGGGTCLLDTPGTRELGLVRDTGGLDAAFVDVVQLAGACRFADCRHDREAGCAVLGAVADGKLPEARRVSYLELRAEIEELDEKRENRERRIGEGRRPRQG